MRLPRTRGRPNSLIGTCDQWVRAAHTQTAVQGDDGALTLSWNEPALPEPDDGEGCLARGLATDRLCRVYRLHEHHVNRLAVGPTISGLDYSTLPKPVVMVGRAPAEMNVAAGPDFAAQPSADLVDGAGIAIDDDDRLYLSDRGSGTISVLDLWSRRLLRTIAVATPTHPDRFPVGLTAHGQVAYAAVRSPAGLLWMSSSRGPVEIDLPASSEGLPDVAEPSRVAVLPDGAIVMLFHDGDGNGWLASGSRPAVDVGPTSDMIVDALGAVVLAPCPSAEGAPGRTVLRRLMPVGDGWTRSTPLDAAGYHGSGLVLTVDGRIGYFTESGFRLAVTGSVDYATVGSCTTYRLDSGVPRNRWGRLLLEACVPDGTEVLVALTASDDDFDTSIPHTLAEPADCIAATATPESMALPPELLIGPDPGERARRLHPRRDPVTSWWRLDERYATFEAPSFADRGRYAWVTVRLVGNGRRTPRVREVRVERQAHTLMQRLPEIFSTGEQEDFLHRYLATFDGLLHDLEIRSRCRDILLDPLGTPGEALDWLGSFFALALDDRWAEPARRRLIAEIVLLYRRRGTLWALGRYIEIFLAGDRANDDQHAWLSPVIIEHFRLRGLGGPLLGEDPTTSTRSVVGFGFRVGGAVDDLDGSPLDKTQDEAEVFASTAHRFTVLVPQPLGTEDEAAIRHILDTERPAHTTYDLCTVDAGMRVGNGLHLGLSTIVGPTGAFEAALTDLSLLGRGALLGGPTTGVAVEAARLGVNARVG